MNDNQRAMRDRQPDTVASRRGWLTARHKALLVHIYTASTVIVLLLSTHLLLRGQLTAALFVLLLAVVIDATDGALARRFRVKEVMPEVDGRRLDDIVDYLSFVFLPVVFMLSANMLLEPMVVFGTLPLLTSAFGFARADAKLDEEGFFLGFPSYWNIVVTYLYLLSTPTWLNTGIIIFLAIMVLVPTRYIYITRFPYAKGVNYGGAWLAGIMLLAAFVVDGIARLLLVSLSLIFPIYYTIYSFWLDWRARRSVEKPSGRER